MLQIRTMGYQDCVSVESLTPSLVPLHASPLCFTALSFFVPNVSLSPPDFQHKRQRPISPVGAFPAFSSFSSVTRHSSTFCSPGVTSLQKALTSAVQFSAKQKESGVLRTCLEP